MLNHQNQFRNSVKVKRAVVRNPWFAKSKFACLLMWNVYGGHIKIDVECTWSEDYIKFYSIQMNRDRQTNLWKDANFSSAVGN